MLEGVGKTVSEFIEERLSSPLLGTFLLSWSAWNYKFLVILFSNNTVSTTFELIETVAFPNAAAVLLRGVLLPLLTTLAYIYVYPYPAKLVYAAWRRTQYDLTKIRQQYADETLLSLEESRELRAQLQGLRDDLEKANASVDAARADVEAYQRRVVELERQAEVLQTSRDQHADGQKRAVMASQAASDRLAALEPQIKALQSELSTVVAARDKLAADLERAEIRRSADTSSEDLPPPQRNLLIQLAHIYGDSVSWQELVKGNQGSDAVVNTYLINDLLERGLLTRIYNQSGEETGIAFTQEGRGAIFDDLHQKKAA